MAEAALILDMDGVIVDSNPLHRLAWVEYNRTQGLETTEEMQQSMYGKRNDGIIRDFFGNGLSDAEVFARGAAKEVIYRRLVGPLLPGALIPGLRAFLERHQDLAIGCATNAEPENVGFVLETAGIQHLFRVSVDGHQVARPKPFPDIYLRAAELLGVPPARCLVFEDSYPGVDAAHAAGMKVVALRTTHREFDNVELAVDDFLAPELEPFVAAFVREGEGAK
jgi:beta-phosphoglucomutase-like phosphatase (HAD superfamily)